MGTAHAAEQYQVLFSVGTQRIWCSVIRRTFRRDATLITRLGHVPIAIPRHALDGLDDVQAVALAVTLLADRLAPFLAPEEPPASPSGDHGGPGWSQPTLNLDLSS
jgi:hypothetical protein